MVLSKNGNVEFADLQSYRFFLTFMNFVKVRRFYAKGFLKVFSTFTHTMQKGIIAIVGTTGVGKSDLGVQLAKTLQGEIINGDSMQVNNEI